MTENSTGVMLQKSADGNKTVLESPTQLGSPGLDSLIFTASLDLTALDPYGDQNIRTTKVLYDT